MSLTGKLVQKVDVTCPGYLVHDIYKHKPNQCGVMTPNKVKCCELVSGQWGAPGSVISWQFFLDGKVNSAKEIIEAVDDKTYKVVFKVIEGELLEAYKAVTITIHIEDIGMKQSVIWTVDFEKVNPSIPDPTALLDLLSACVKDIDAYILKNA